MSTPHVALLRGVNVGPSKRIAMADLRAIAEGLGHTRVRTLLNSGNLVFEAPPRPDHAERLEAALGAQHGLKSRVTVLTADQLAAAAGENPFHHEALNSPSKLLVTFPRTPESLARLGLLTGRDWTPEGLAVGGHAAFSWHPDGLSGGVLAEALDRAGKGDVTARNWATVLKLQAACAVATGSAA
jgi:uncharacterized protein (DUF1697 family)